MSSNESKSTGQWSLFDQSEEHRLDNLELSEVKTIIKSIAPRRLNLWLARPNETSEWKSLWDFSELDLPPLNLNSDTQPGNDAADDSMTASSSGIIDDLTLEIDVAGLQERRGSRRYAKEYKVIVENKNESFETKTINISLSGIRIQDAVPSWAGNIFELTLCRDEDQLKVLCSKVSGGQGQKLLIEKISAPDLLRQWLLL